MISSSLSVSPSFQDGRTWRPHDYTAAVCLVRLAVWKEKEPEFLIIIILKKHQERVPSNWVCVGFSKMSQFQSGVPWPVELAN